MPKSPFGQRGAKPGRDRAPASSSGKPGGQRPRPSRLDANFPEARGNLPGNPAEGKRWVKRKRPQSKPKTGGQVSDAAAKGRSGAPGAPGTPGEGRGRPPYTPGLKQGFKARGHQRPGGKSAAPAISEPMRIAKAMARAGLCSRRDAERWIAEGRVAVNGSVISSPALDVGPADKVVVDGAPLPAAEPPRLWRYHKPRGLVTTHKDPEGRATVFDHLPPGLPRVVSIGRLDFNTEGLLLLTNDGELARHLELPSTGWLRRYRVRAYGSITQERLDALKDGIEVDGVRYGPIEATLDTQQGHNCWLTLGLREGKNREVRNILSSLELTVNRLIRISYGPFQLLELKEGQAESVKRRVLADQLGPELTERFHLAPEPEPQPGKGRPDKQGRPPRK